MNYKVTIEPTPEPNEFHKMLTWCIANIDANRKDWS